MLRSVLHRQRFHTQDEREMNTEDAGVGWGVTWGPDHFGHCHSNRFTAPGWNLRWVQEEVLRLRFATCITIGEATDLDWICTDCFSFFSAAIKLSCTVDFWCNEGTSQTTEEDTHEVTPLASPELERWAPMHLKFLRELSVVTVVRATEPQHIVLFHQWARAPMLALMFAVRLPACPPSYKRSLPVDFSEAIIEWTLRQG